MCLAIAIERPDDVIDHGTIEDYEYMIIHNGTGYRCGYVKLLPGHPWYGVGYNDIPCEVHGSLTFSEPDTPCDKGGPDNGYWIGFDCAHKGIDAPDPMLPCVNRRVSRFLADTDGTVKSTEYVLDEIRFLIDQAKKVIYAN